MNTKMIAVAIVVVLVVGGAGAYMLIKNNNDDRSIDIDVNLEVFGNADKDGKISQSDADLTERYIQALNSDNDAEIEEIESLISLDFADANQDGKIDSKDVDQIKALVSGDAEYVWLLDGVKADGSQDVRKIGRDIDRIGCEYFANTELCLILGLADKIAAVDYAPAVYKDFYFTADQRDGLFELGNMNTPNYDEVNKADMDILLTFYTNAYEAKQDKIYDCDVLYLGLYNPDLTNTSKSSFVQGVLKAGYIFGVVERAQSYVDWLIDYRDDLMGLADSIPESDKKTVMTHTYNQRYFADGTNMTLNVYKPADPLGQAIILGGGHNVYDDFAESDITSSNNYGAVVSVDKVLGTNTTVDYIFLHMVRYTYGGAEMANTPHHGYLVDDDSEMRAGQEAVRDLEFVEDDMGVYLVAGEFRNGCTGGVLLGAYIGSIVNPDVYKDIDPVKMMNEYVVDWMGIDNYDVTENGQFIYGN